MIQWQTYADRKILNIKPANLKNIRVAWTEDYGGVAPMDDRIRLFSESHSHPENTFHSLDSRNPDFSDARLFLTLRWVNYLASHKERYEKHRKIL